MLSVWQLSLHKSLHIKAVIVTKKKKKSLTTDALITALLLSKCSSVYSVQCKDTVLTTAIADLAGCFVSIFLTSQMMLQWWKK